MILAIMVPDGQTNTVFISDLLFTKHLTVANALKKLLGDRLGVIPGTRDIWCRDYMPIQLSSDRYVQFRYDPDYLKQDSKHRTENAAELLDLPDCICSDLAIDGGNIVRWHDAAILTSKFYSENPHIASNTLDNRLRELLEIERLIIIPPDPDDTLGHSDGLVRFVDAKTVFVSDYSNIDRRYQKDLIAALKRYRLELIPFPLSPTTERGTDPDIDPAVGVYINFLQIEGLIVCPIFGQAADEKAIRILERTFLQDQIVTLDAHNLALDGGVLNCVTWNIRH